MRNLNPLPMTRKLYEERFLLYLQGWAKLHGYNVTDNLPAGLLKELTDAVCEQIRREYQLPKDKHLEYKANIIKAIDIMRAKLDAR